MAEASFSDKQFSSIQYKIGVNDIPGAFSQNKIDSLDQLLSQETVSNVADSWVKLDKTTRIKKLKTYVRTKLSERLELNEVEADKCLRYMVRNMDRQLRRVKDVEYDKESGEVMDIPAFEFNAKSRAFTMKRESPAATPVRKRGKGSVKSRKSDVVAVTASTEM